MSSRVAKKPVLISPGVEVKLNDSILTVKGKLGELNQKIHSLVNCSIEGEEINFSMVGESTEAKALSGTMRSLANSMVIGVHEGFTRKLIMVGVGYRAKVEGKSLNLSAGFSHPVNMPIPDGISIEVPSNTEIVVKGISKHAVGQYAANIRAKRPPEPYKGKGIRYENERIILKEGKKK